MTADLTPEEQAIYDRGFADGTQAAREWMPENCRRHPVSNVRWLPRELLQANDYNPNRVAPPELKLLRVSILEDGWTQPCVVRPEGERYEIVDGYHRWETAGKPDIYDLTDGLVPAVEITPDPASQRMSTIRHNRARGTHHVVKMADIVADLDAQGITVEEFATRLGMSEEEVRRLIERGKMTERGRAEGMGEAWRPAPRA